MFGYVTPCKMELKIKDYQMFKSYYCGLCLSIKNNYGNIPRLVLNYDMTFLAILLDSLNNSKVTFKKGGCITHPLKKRVFIINNDYLDYAAFCNVALAYYKLVDNVNDDNSVKSRFFSIILKKYFNKIPENLKTHVEYIKSKLEELSSLEDNCKSSNIDELCHPFADLTGFIISSYNTEKNHTLYWLGYNLGKWIYICDAYDDLQKDMKDNKFNAINSIFNTNNLCYDKFNENIKNRIDFLLTTCAQQCLNYLSQLQLKKNKAILYNILQYGLMQKMDTIFKRSEENEKSL